MSEAEHAALSSASTPIPAIVMALARADFSALVRRFTVAGMLVEQPEHGILQISAPQHDAARARVLISVCIHGDETGPLEMMAHLLDELAERPEQLTLDLMLVIGNPAAIAQGQRFIEADLNRMFSDERGDLARQTEAARADVIMRATAAFFDGAASQRWHLDLHTARRRSLYPAFAVVPQRGVEVLQQSLGAWLGAAGIDALIVNSPTAGTYSAYTAHHFAVDSCTVELGQIRSLGQNQGNLFAAANTALKALLTGKPLLKQRVPQVFSVAQELIKHSAAFRLHCDPALENFRCFDQNTVIADDGEIVYRVQNRQEYIVFPNPDVRIGLRAGLMLVRVDVADWR